MQTKDKRRAVRDLISAFARDFPRKNHVILVDMTTGSWRVDEMLTQEITDIRKEVDNNDDTFLSFDRLKSMCRFEKGGLCEATLQRCEAHMCPCMEIENPDSNRGSECANLLLLYSRNHM